MGSPKTHRAKWLTDTPRVKTIVSVYETRELAEIAENGLILDFWAVSKPLSLNVLVSGAKFNWLGQSHTAEHRAKLSKLMTERNLSKDNPNKCPEVLAAKSEFMRNNNPGQRESHREYMRSNSNPAKKLENRKKASAAMTAICSTSVACPCCDKTGNLANMKRWHFANCLEHPDNKGLTRKQIKDKRKC